MATREASSLQTMGTKSKRAELQARRAKEPGPSDAGGVWGLFGVIGAMGVCCGLLPLIIWGSISTAALWAVAPWLGAVAGVVVAVIAFVVWRRRRERAAATSAGNI